jgi:hypothetical protein
LVNAGGGRHEAGQGHHHSGDRLAHVFLEAQVAAGEDAFERVVGVHYRNATDVVLAHELAGVGQRSSGGQGEGVLN